MEVSLGRQVIAGLRWSTLSRLVAQVLTWVSTFVVIRLVTPADFGLAALAAVFANFLSIMSEMGLAVALVQRQVREEDIFRPVLTLVVILGVALCVLLIVAAPGLAWLSDEPRIAPLVQVISLQFIAMAFSVVPRARLSIDLRFRAISIVEVVSAVLGAAVTLVLAWRGFGALSLIIGAVSLNVFRAVLLNFYAPSLYRPDFGFGKLRGFGKFSGIVLLQRTIWYWYMQADTFIVARLLGASLLGIYSLGRQFTTIPLERAMGVINPVAFPAYSKIKDDPVRTRQSYLKALRVGAIYAFPVFWGLASVSDPLVNALLGAEWTPSIAVIQVLCAVMPLRMLNAFSMPAATAIDRQDVTLKSLILAIFVVPAGVLVGQRWGVVGAAAGWAVTFPIVYVVDAWLLKRALGIALREMVEAVVPPTLASAAMSATIFVATRAYLGQLSAWAELAVDLPLGVLSFFVFLRLVGRRNSDEAWEFLRAMLGLRARDG